LIEEFSLALKKSGFEISDWGYDKYKRDDWFSRHIDILRTPFPDKYLIELKIGWGNGYASNKIPPRIKDFGNCYLNDLGVNWLHPDYPEKFEGYLFGKDDIDFISGQGIHFISRWFDLHTSLEFLIGLAEYQGKFKSNIPYEIYSYLGFASNSGTKNYDGLAFLYAMKGEYKKALNYLSRYGVSDHSGCEWTMEFNEDLNLDRSRIVKPYDYRSKYTRCGGIFLDENADQHRKELFNCATERVISPNNSSKKDAASGASS